jgi:hypothetical protein
VTNEDDPPGPATNTSCRGEALGRAKSAVLLRRVLDASRVRRATSINAWADILIGNRLATHLERRRAERTAGGCDPLGNYQARQRGGCCAPSPTEGTEERCVPQLRIPARRSINAVAEMPGVRHSNCLVDEHCAFKSQRIPSRSWHELITKVWEVDPLLCLYDNPVSAPDAPRGADQRRADHRAPLAACWRVGCPPHDHRREQGKEPKLRRCEYKECQCATLSLGIHM